MSQRIADLHTHRSNNISFFTVGIIQQCEARSAVWIVLNRRNLRRDFKLIAFEINNTDKTTMSTTLVTDRNTTIYITTTMVTRRNDQ